MDVSNPVRQRHAVVRVGAVAILLTSLLVACSSDDPDVPPENSSVPESTTPDAGCLAEWPTRIWPETDDREEESYLESTPLCSSDDASEIIMINNSEVVWSFTDASSDQFSTVDGDERATSFREFLDYNMPAGYELIAPTEIRTLPSDRAVSYHIDRELTKIWLAHDVYLSTMSTYSTTLAKRVVTNGSKAKQAVFDCTLAFAQAMKDNQPSTQPADTEKQVLNGLGIAAGTGSCMRSWNAAHVEAGNEPFPSWADRVARAGEVADNVTKVHKGMGWLRTLCAAVPRYC